SAQQIEGIPNFKNCKDNSLDRAMTDGITLGISPRPPFSSLDPNTKNAEGLDVEIHQAALKWIGIKDVKYEVAPFGQLIPLMLSKRTDFVASHIIQTPARLLYRRMYVVASNIRQTPARLRVVPFSPPAWWYGPAIVAQKGNPKAI